jgi:hypothetical protein
MTSPKYDGGDLDFSKELGDPRSQLRPERDPVTGQMTDASSQRSDKSKVRDVNVTSSSTRPPSTRPRWLIPVVALLIGAVGIAMAFAFTNGIGTDDTILGVDSTQSSVTTVASTSTDPEPSSVVPLLGFGGAYELVGEDLEVLNVSGIWSDAGTVIDIGDGVVSYVNSGALRNGSFSFVVDGPGQVDSCGTDTCVLTIPGKAPRALAISMTPEGQLTVVDIATLQQRGAFCGFPVRVEEGAIEPVYSADGVTVESFRYTTSFGSGSGGPDGCEDAIEVALTLVGTRVP